MICGSGLKIYQDLYCNKGIKAYLFALIALAVNYLLALFQAIRSLWGKEELGKPFQDCCELLNFPQGWTLGRSFGNNQDSSESCNLGLELVDPKEVNRALMSSATCGLDPCPFWLIKVSSEVAYVWPQMVNTCGRGWHNLP